MIVDDIRNWKMHFKKPFWESVFGEIEFLHDSTPKMEKSIQNDDIILKVFSYQTFGPADPGAELEAHKKYIDIHTTIAGSERIDWYPVSVVKPLGSYSEKDDAIFYARKEPPPASIIMRPGMFAAFWPEDAHMPRIMTGNESELIKKAVFKIKVDLG